jgi:hypothetical protein
VSHPCNKPALFAAALRDLRLTAAEVAIVDDRAVRVIAGGPRVATPPNVAGMLRTFFVVSPSEAAVTWPRRSLRMPSLSRSVDTRNPGGGGNL